MAPKVVYGKKKPASCPQTSFSNFVSSDKKDIAKQKPKQVENANRQDRKQELNEQLAVRSDDDALLSLEKSLQALRLGQKHAHVDGVESKERCAVPKRHRSCADHNAKENSSEVNGDKEFHSGATDVISVAQRGEEEAGPRRRKGKPRKVLEDRNVNGTRGADHESIDKVGQVTCPPRTPSPSCKTSVRTQRKAKSTLNRQECTSSKPTSDNEDVYSVFASPLLSLSAGASIVPFSQWSAELEPHFTITKIAEASFSEVYRLSARSATNLEDQESVLKMIALKTPPNAPLPCQMHNRTVRDRESQEAKEKTERDETDQWKSDVADVLSEVKLLQNLNQIPGFTNFRELTVLQGRPSPPFASAWKSWNKSRARGMKSEFPDPSRKSSYDDTQLWAVVEMQDAGTDCEKLMEMGRLRSIWEIWDVFWGVCLSVAKAEETCRFEHRDLHMGNICVRSVRSGVEVADCTVQDPLQRKFKFTGLETTVIDYTLSRADLLAPPSHLMPASTIDHSWDGCLDVAFLDLDKDPALFEGDASIEYQYEIYRYMRGAALYNKPFQSTPPQEEAQIAPRRSPRKNTHIRFDEEDGLSQLPQKALARLEIPTVRDLWREFHPKTNLVWVHFVLHKLIKHLVEGGQKPDQLSAQKIMVDLGTGEVEEPQKIKKKAMKLYKVLSKVGDLLCPIALGREESLGSVKELVVLALEERWLRVGDVAS